MNPEIKILETPRDGFQGIIEFIPTKKKIDFINILLNCGFHTVEVGSIVSDKAIPQMADTIEILDKLDYSNTKSRIAILVANEKGGKIAMDYEIVNDLIYPFSISETFLRKNINQDFIKAEETIDNLLNLCLKNSKQLIPFLSMGLGNPYGDEWSLEILDLWTEKFKSKGIKYIPVSDIMGEASKEKIHRVFNHLVSEYPDIEFGFHLHSAKEKARDKVDAAYKAGIRRFDTVLGGFGGCPMTGKELLGNLALDILMDYCTEEGIKNGLDLMKVQEANMMISSIR